MPKDFSGVFSRQFVVGHFLPAFFGLAIATLVASDDALPDAYRGIHDLGGKLLALGVAALPVGLLLSGVHAHVVRQFTGEATERQMAEDAARNHSRRRWRPADWLRAVVHGWHERRVKRETREYEKWRENEAVLDSNPVAALSVEQRWPHDGEGMLPTRLGNAMRACHSHAKARYGLDGELIWPHIEMLLSDQERALIADARTDVTFFLNCAVASMLLGAWIVVDRVIRHHANWFGWLLVAVLVGLLFRLFRLLAVTATYRWAKPVRAAVDLHRLELYERLGLSRPTTREAEGELAASVNRRVRAKR